MQGLAQILHVEETRTASEEGTIGGLETRLPTTKDFMEDRRLISTKALQYAAWGAFLVLAAVLASFAAIYVWDRYIHAGDQSPVQLEIQSLEQAVHQDPRNPEARIGLAEVYLLSGRYAEAVEQAEQVSSLFPDNTNALLTAGIGYVRMGQPEAALYPLRRFVELRGERPMARVDTSLEAAYYFLGESYVGLGRPAEAIPVLEAALLISPTDADALYQAGLAYQALLQPEMALERYHKAVRLVPDFAEAYAGMVESYSTLNQPNHEDYARGMVAFSRGDYRSAISYLENASEALPDFAPAFLGVGLAYERTGRLEAASAAIQRALELNPDDFAAQQASGRIETALSQGN
jgi:tetratricopeptide (TPR) repeat protein